ncbi:MAG TPA: hypothetical protein VNX01_15535 [Bacteroidia bacterium]|jgi:hypothetical protein|nr:hypothetical protein [Bacteroidia bacterium]
MKQITHLNFNNGVYSFNVNGTGVQLINAGQFENTNVRFKSKNPKVHNINDRFVEVGSGNYKIDNVLVQEVGVVILCRVSDGVNYSIEHWRFRDNFENE